MVICVVTMLIFMFFTFGQCGTQLVLSYKHYRLSLCFVQTTNSMLLLFFSFFSYSKINGTCNNPISEAIGSSQSKLKRLLPADYADGVKVCCRFLDEVHGQYNT